MLSTGSDLRRAGGAAAVVLSLASVVAGCGSSGGGDTAGTQQPTLSASSRPAGPSANAAPKPGASLPTSFPKQQLRVTELPRTGGAVRAALATYLRFESLVRDSLRTHHVSPRLRTLASTPLFHTIVASADNMRRKSIVLTGPTDLAVTGARGTADVVALNLCFDVTRARQVVDGVAKPLDGPSRAKARSVLTDQGGSWRVTEYTFHGDAC